MSPGAVEKMAIVDLTVQDILTSSGRYPERPLLYLPTPEVIKNATVLVERLNRLHMYWEHQLRLTSGYRPAEVNAKIPNAAKHSNHIIGAAADIADPDGSLAKFVLADLPMLEHLQLWIEDPEFTKYGWVHFQIIPPASGRRVFHP